ncbi:MAG: PmoA family protein [Planctomycetota bacterium]
MKKLLGVLVTVALSTSGWCVENPSVIFDKESISFVVDSHVLWKLNHIAEEGKPYFHPISTSRGALLTDLRPDDHPWHRGVWFSWKFINGVNYWEEDRQTGRSQGQTILQSVERTSRSNQEVRVEMRLAYGPSIHEAPVLTEHRVLDIAPPNKHGIYTIDWSSRFVAQAEQVFLDRTPLENEPGGKSWGGYAGFSVRLAPPAFHARILNSSGMLGGEAVRQPAAWVAYSLHEGGGLAIFDHPRNVAHPVKWYISEGMPYVGPALLHDRSITLRPRQEFFLRYRLVVFSDQLSDKKTFQDWWEQWISTCP